MNIIVDHLEETFEENIPKQSTIVYMFSTSRRFHKTSYEQFDT